ncbi:hypothetical protein [Halomicronema sp. CCY15110]|nr:hypothetical protein [Halomicronema sp. CCY15110]
MVRSPPAPTLMAVAAFAIAEIIGSRQVPPWRGQGSGRSHLTGRR